MVSTIAGSARNGGSIDGTGTAARFGNPWGIAVDSAGHIYVCDALLDAVQIFDDAGRLLLSFGRQGTGNGEFWMPSGICIDRQDYIYVADTYNQRIQVFRYVTGPEPASAPPVPKNGKSGAPGSPLQKQKGPNPPVPPVSR